MLLKDWNSSRNSHMKPRLQTRRIARPCSSPTASEKIATLVKAAGIEIESYWPMLFGKMAEKCNVTNLLMNVGACGGGGGAPATASAPAGGGAAAAAADTAKEVKKDEPAEESDGDLGFGLFN